MMLTGFSSWIGRTGMINNYWHGNGSTIQTGCKCGLDKSCAKILHHTSCNCDSYLENMKDIGVLTSMDQLPVKNLNYGGAFSSFGSIQFDLGPLICSGKSKPYPSESIKEEILEMKSKIQKFIDTTTTSQQALIDEIESKKYKSLQAVILIAKIGRSTRSWISQTTTESAWESRTGHTTSGTRTGHTTTGTSVVPASTVPESTVSTSDTIFSQSRNPSVGYKYGELT